MPSCGYCLGEGTDLDEDGYPICPRHQAMALEDRRPEYLTRASGGTGV
jgi:hypothetical protein